MQEKIKVFISHLWNNNLNSVTEKTIATIIGVLILFIIRVLILRISKKNAVKEIAYMRWKKGTSTGFYVFAILLVSFIWVEGFKTFATLIAVISAGMAIAFKEPLMNLGGWAYILARRPFIIGDRIEIGGNMGEVLDIRIFMFTLQEVGGNRVGAEQTTGRLIHVPNGKVFTEFIYNFTETRPFIYHELNLTLSATSNWQKVESKFLDIMEKHPEFWKAPQKVKSDNNFREYYLFESSLTPECFVRINPQGIELSLRHTVDPRKIRKVEDAIWRELITYIQAENDLDLAFQPTRVYWDASNTHKIL
jgi:small-conductance mechanosensitive channel